MLVWERGGSRVPSKMDDLPSHIWMARLQCQASFHSSYVASVIKATMMWGWGLAFLLMVSWTVWIWTGQSTCLQRGKAWGFWASTRGYSRFWLNLGLRGPLAVVCISWVFPTLWCQMWFWVPPSHQGMWTPGQTKCWMLDCLFTLCRQMSGVGLAGSADTPLRE